MFFVNGQPFPTYDAAFKEAASLVTKLKSQGYKPIKAKMLPKDNLGAQGYIFISPRNRLEGVILEQGRSNPRRPAVSRLGSA